MKLKPNSNVERFKFFDRKTMNFFGDTMAVNLYNKADFEHAKKRAIDSLRYSVGIFHADYKKASA